MSKTFTTASNFYRDALRPFRLGRFRLLVDPLWSNDSVEQVLTESEALGAPEFAENRRRGKVVAPSSGYSDSFVKRYAPTDAQSIALKRRHPLHRLRSRYAYNEGAAYCFFRSAGIAVPKVHFFGEQWRFGFRGEGVVAIEFLDGRLVQDELLGDEPGYWVENTVDAVIKMHQLGYTHGDANLINFIAVGRQSYAIDLENSRRVTDKKRSSDLVNILKSVHFSTGSRELMGVAASRYEESGLRLPQSAGDLFSKALFKADRHRARVGNS